MAGIRIAATRIAIPISSKEGVINMRIEVRGCPIVDFTC